MGKKNKVKNQHYVPQCYLKNFVNVHSGHVYVFDKWNQKSFGSQPRNLASESYFYDTELTLDETSDHFQIFEKALSEIEGKAPPTISRIIQTKTISPEDRRFMSVWMSVQHLRTRGAREEHQQTLNQASDYLVRMVAAEIGLDNPEDLSIKPAKETPTKEQILSVFGEPQAHIAECLFNHIWIIGINDDTQTQLITSDQPVLKVPSKKPDVISYDGFASPGIEVFYPLSPKHILWIKERSEFPLFDAQDGRPLNLNESMVHRFNQIQVEGGYRYVYSAKDNFATVRKLCRENPDLMKPPNHKLLIQEDPSSGIVHMRGKR